jgi:hypothetical protein
MSILYSFSFSSSETIRFTYTILRTPNHPKSSHCLLLCIKPLIVILFVSHSLLTSPKTCLSPKSVVDAALCPSNLNSMSLVIGLNHTSHLDFSRQEKSLGRYFSVDLLLVQLRGFSNVFCIWV